MSFDATTTISSEFGIFGIPMTEEESRVVLLPVPWEVTTSYGSGASLGPALIRTASEQIDLFDLELGRAYEKGFHMLPISQDILALNDKNKKKAQELIALVTEQSQDAVKMEQLRSEINQASHTLNEWVYSQSTRILESGKLLGLVGGDHSSPYGAIRAVSEKTQGEFGVLHIDAHSDTRKAYHGFTHSHASIMYNVMTAPWKPKKLVQLGIRDFCEEEHDFIKSRNDIKTFFDLDVKRRLLSGEAWARVVQDVIKELPDQIYISFDIDGLDPAFCPHTGTPVAGGYSTDQIYFLFSELAASGKKIVGFDLNEVSTGGVPLDEANPWDGNVGARVLFKLCGWSVLTNKA
ncbi:MAG: agmatinase family protein [Bdellovibrionales bacterium]